MKNEPLRKSELVRCPGGSWWLTASQQPREQWQATADQQVPRMRQTAVGYFNEAANRDAGTRLLKKMRSAL
jgi:hypothetical protein